MEQGKLTVSLTYPFTVGDGPFGVLYQGVYYDIDWTGQLASNSPIIPALKTIYRRS